MTEQSSHIRVTVILPSLIFGGGIETHLVKMLRNADHDRFVWSLVTLFDHPGRPDLYGEVPPHVKVIRLASHGMTHLSTWRELYGTLRLLAPDVVMTSMFSPNAMARVLKPFFGYKVVTREHNTYDEKRLHHRIIDHMLSYTSDVLVAVSDEVADYASRQAWIPRRKFTVINNGVDIDIIEDSLKDKEGETRRVRSELGLSDDAKIVLNVARLKPTKDHSLLLDAFSRFHILHPEYHLVIAGDGSDRPKIEARIKELGLEDVVHLLGYRHDIYAWFAAADMFALSSKREGFPNVGIEALAFGLPFITTKVAGVAKIVREGENGHIVERTPEALSHAMQHIASLSSEERSRMEERCKAISRTFDIKRVTEAYESLFEHCA